MESIYLEDIKELAKVNENYRKVVYTYPKKFQFVVMSLLPYEEIGMEVHPHTVQFIYIVKGKGLARLKKNGKEKTKILEKDSGIIISPGTYHNIENVSDDKELKLFTVYSPPEHKSYLIQKYKP